jgi:cholesterol transport system auxiliary component
MIRRPFVPLLTVAALGLSGCVSLLPETDPVQLYRFGRTPAALTEAPPAARVPVLLNAVEFPQASRGDRILTVNGGAVAYLAESRWAAPAETLFSEALERAFEERAGASRLIGRREVEPGRLLLDVDVRSFEARYEAGTGAAPTVVVSLRARVLRLPDRTTVEERMIETRETAAENRVSAIVAAFDSATDRALSDLVSFTDRQAAAVGGA